jgi:hypothetical protein
MKAGFGEEEGDGLNVGSPLLVGAGKGPPARINDRVTTKAGMGINDGY